MLYWSSAEVRGAVLVKCRGEGCCMAMGTTLAWVMQLTPDGAIVDITLPACSHSTNDQWKPNVGHLLVTVYHTHEQT